MGNYIEGPELGTMARLSNIQLIKVAAYALLLFNGLSVAALLWARKTGMALIFAGNCWVILAYMKIRQLLDSYISESQN